MNFLGLVNEVERESGTVNVRTSKTTDVASPASLRQEKIIAHVNMAYEEIQLSRGDWPWRQDEFSHALTIGQTRYSATDLGIASFSRWTPTNPDEDILTIYDPAIGKADETGLIDIGYRGWRERYAIGVHDAQRPCAYAIDPTGRLCFGPKPDKAYVVGGLYQRGVHLLVANGDTPILPADHHRVIVWKALVLLHGADEGEFALGNAASHYRAAFRQLVNDMPEMMGD